MSGSSKKTTLKGEARKGRKKKATPEGSWDVD